MAIMNTRKRKHRKSHCTSMTTHCLIVNYMKQLFISRFPSLQQILQNFLVVDKQTLAVPAQSSNVYNASFQETVLHIGFVKKKKERHNYPCFRRIYDDSVQKLVLSSITRCEEFRQCSIIISFSLTDYCFSSFVVLIFL